MPPSRVEDAGSVGLGDAPIGNIGKSDEVLPTDGGFVTEKLCLSLARARTKNF